MGMAFDRELRGALKLLLIRSPFASLMNWAYNAVKSAYCHSSLGDTHKKTLETIFSKICRNDYIYYQL